MALEETTSPTCTQQDEHQATQLNWGKNMAVRAAAVSRSAQGSNDLYRGPACSSENYTQPIWYNRFAMLRREGGLCFLEFECCVQNSALELSL